MVGGITLNHALLGLYVPAALGALLLLRALRRPLGWMLRLAWRAAVGGAVIWVLDLAGASLGVHVGINPLTVLLVGVLGLPGLALLVALRVWMP
ncbi:MAG: pro-sigmaK processing inhibitor BofA family protein [Thermaerobacter sp.]|jgi:inhibitor of the pro-sigma K processing machinery|nr:pro-sigmaK processing inhibitor BofA family protein [Thermaerobacter sp.]MDA8144827.1 pro-sigmaK processing inhibitor BofA family protein [Thermaerobacter sp.]